MADNTRSRLLALPHKLRDIIYDMTFEDDILDLDCKNRSPTSIGILIACKQTYAEALDIYYRNITTRSPRFDRISMWCQTLRLKYPGQSPKIHYTLQTDS